MSKHPIRHLIVMIDGTWISASFKKAMDRHSNVYKLTSYVELYKHSESQIVFYLPGIGSHTYGLPYLNGIFAFQLPLDVERAFINISTNYHRSEPEDEQDKIYLFGFSRGAVVARLVADLIGKYGLLRPSQIEMFPYIWDDYVGKRKISNLDKFKGQYCYGNNEIHIEFMGVFDTVLGNYNGDAGLEKIFFKDRMLGGHVNTTLHILARDETRSLFSPVVFENTTNSNQILEQVWMPGVHSDIGGGYPDDFLSKVSLLTMLDRVRAHTLLEVDFYKVEELKTSIKSDIDENKIVINNELTQLFWRLWKEERRPNNTDKCQFIHPIYKFLVDRSFTNKQKANAFFEMPKFPFEEYANVKSLKDVI